MSKSVTSFGDFVRYLRERRDLSLRELGRLADIDHAYIHRLESGEKESPSDEIVSALRRALKVSPTEAALLSGLRARAAPSSLVELLLGPEGESYTDLFDAALSMSFRGVRPESSNDWKKFLDKLRAFQSA